MFFGAIPPADAQVFERDTRRAGSTYAVNTFAATPEQCRLACGDDATCRAWSFVHAMANSTPARCELKAAAPPPQIDPCCVSGLAPELEAPSATAPRSSSALNTVAPRPKPETRLAGAVNAAPEPAPLPAPPERLSPTPTLRRGR
ncbi:MAG: PAN domain-containing protein [Maricaulaceae bacterium]